MFRKVSAFFTAALFFTLSLSIVATAKTNEKESSSVRVPLNLAILIQDDLTSQVGNELGVTRDFIRALPAGSRVMVAYITSGSLQVRQPFTNDLNRAANSLRTPRASTAASAFNPYVVVVEALKKFDSSWQGHNALLLISDGLDTSPVSMRRLPVTRSISIGRSKKQIDAMWPSTRSMLPRWA
jgi:hypothetical protein